MKKLMLLAPLIALMLCGFAPARHDAGPMPVTAPMDATDSTVDMYKNGTIKASYWVSVHADPKAGQYWETSSEAYGTKMTNRWQVASVDGDTAIVENQMKMNSEYVLSDYVIAYKVNLKAEAGEVNVTKAWIGRPDKDGAEIKIMEKPEALPKDPDAKPNYEMTEEDFKDLELAGKKWSGKKTTIKGQDWESTTWVATDGWFGGVVKTEASGMTTELKSQGEDAKALLTLPKEADEDAEKDDKKKD